MTDAEWDAAGVHAIGLRLAGDAIDERGPRGERIVDDTLLLLMNAGAEGVAFRLPSAPRGWQLILDTRSGAPPNEDGGPLHEGGSGYELIERSLALFRLVKRR
jgi:glycogen operon protein